MVFNKKKKEDKSKNIELVDDDISKIKIPDSLPILPLRDVVIYPTIITPLMVSRMSSVKLVEEALLADKMIGLVAQKKAEIEKPETSDLFSFGSVGIILKMLRLPDNSLRILVQGLQRIKIVKYSQTVPYMKANFELVEDKLEPSKELDALSANLTNQFSKLISMIPYLPSELQVLVMNIKNLGTKADLIASNLNLTNEERESVLEMIDVKQRLEKVSSLVQREIELLELGSKIQTEVQSELDKTQKEYLLRQQLKAIQKELGEKDQKTIEIEELEKKIAEAKMPERAEKEARRELDRLRLIPLESAEHTVARTYLDWLVSLPWSISSQDILDIVRARQVLDEDHYDLEKVKERILEYLAVRKLKGDSRGPILCFVGPPGTGKTSLGKSIARAMGKKFIRLSLGGVRDEAEIRGHRRTYIGALPGRIIQGIKNAGSNNPVFMLDEIDKLGTDFRGDPSSALLEVLDPEQNFSFSDHYLEVPFDLSKVMFITTANILDPIPPALRDRMEVLELLGYTEEEKLHIAKKHLIPRQIKENGLTNEDLSFEDNTIRSIIRNYTMEAGLRNLEREIANVCRKVAKEITEGKKQKFLITTDKLHDYLGPIKFFSEVAERTNEPGVAIGLAWTPSGGDILFIESIKMKGNKGLTLTGQLGNVMKESAQAALSYIRAKSKSLGINDDFFSRYDIHIHVPQGAIPKDGPSAGITIAASLASLLTERPIKPNLAMTGEITLRGRVLPVGGIKEKVLAANRAGIKTVILPKHNEKDLEEVPKDVKNELDFKFVDTVGQVLKLALRNSRLQKESKKL